MISKGKRRLGGSYPLVVETPPTKDTPFELGPDLTKGGIFSWQYSDVAIRQYSGGERALVIRHPVDNFGQCPCKPCSGCLKKEPSA